MAVLGWSHRQVTEEFGVSSPVAEEWRGDAATAARRSCSWRRVHNFLGIFFFDFT